MLLIHKNLKAEELKEVGSLIEFYLQEQFKLEMKMELLQNSLQNRQLNKQCLNLMIYLQCLMFSKAHCMRMTPKYRILFMTNRVKVRSFLMKNLF